MQLPGRENRLGEQPFSRMAPLVESLASAMEPELWKPYALFGHSLGARIGFELARALRRRHQRQPLHLFVSACAAPHIREYKELLHQLSDNLLVDRILKLNGTSAEVQQNPELLELVLPTIRADLTVAETYHHTPEAPLACPITAFGGTHDPLVRLKHLKGWHGYTIDAFSLHLLSGDHFFLNLQRKELLAIIATSLFRSLSDSSNRAAREPQWQEPH
jgi:surfactin synthase thioesterase subunit